MKARRRRLRLLGSREPLGELPAERGVEPAAGSHLPIVHHRTADVAGGALLERGVPTVTEEHSQLLHRALGAESTRRLVGGGAIDGVAGDIHRWHAVDDPVRQHLAHSPAQQDAQRVHACGHPVPVELWRRPQQRVHIGGERLGSAEEEAHADVGQRRDALHRSRQERRHAIPIRVDGAEDEVVRYTIQLPRRRHRFEQPHEHAVALRPVVAVAIGVLHHRQVWAHAGHGIGDQVVVLGGLQRHLHTGCGPETVGPHASGVDDQLGLDAAPIGEHRRHPAAALFHAGGADTLEDARATSTGTFGQRRRNADGVGATLVGHHEAREHVVGAQQRPQRRHFARRDLHLVHAEAVHPCRRTSQRLEPAGVGGQRDVAHLAEARGVPGLGFQSRVQIARVAAHEQRRLVGHPCRRDQPGSVPGGAGGERMPLHEDDIGPTQLSEMVGDAAADDATSDDHHLRPVGQCTRRCFSHLRTPRSTCLSNDS